MASLGRQHLTYLQNAKTEVTFFCFRFKVRKSNLNIFGPFSFSHISIFKNWTFLFQSQNSAKPSGAVTNKKLQKRSQSDPFLLDKCPASSPLQGAPYWEQGAESPCIHTSDSYIYWVVCFCVLAAVLQNLYLLCIFLLFEMIYLVKHMCKFYFLWTTRPYLWPSGCCCISRFSFRRMVMVK